MDVAAFLFVPLEPPHSTGGAAESFGTPSRFQSGAAWDVDARDLAFATRIRGADADDARVAFEALYTSYFPSLWRLARQFTQGDDIAEDMVQDVFMALWVRREIWAVSGSVRAYLYGAVRNRGLNARRDSARIDRKPDMQSIMTGHRADTDAEVRELEAALQVAVDGLPERQRTALLLFWQEGMNMSEIARVLEITPTASRKLLLAAQGNLRRAVAKYL